MDKGMLLRLLDDDEVQRKILSIVRAEPQPSKPAANVFSDNVRPPSMLERQSQDARQLQEARQENYQLKKDLAQSAQKINALQSELDGLKKSARDSERRLEETRRQFERQSEETRRQFQRALSERDATIDRLERDNSSLQGTLKRVREQSAQRFERGWELFQRYQKVSAHARQMLKETGVFIRDGDFTSFICGGAQAESLKMLWDELKDCVLSGRRDDAAILWDIFEYCVELVNASKSQKIYSVLPVQEGDRFDSDVHEEGPNSRAQGKVSKIYLKGYKNIFNGELVRKSIVQVN